MSSYVYWFLLALILVGLEMPTGTFYLLVIAIAMATGGITDLLGFAFVAQLALAALAGIIGILLLQRMKNNENHGVISQSLDIGQAVKVLTFGDNSTARVFYRGAEWDAELEDRDSSHDEVFYIKDIRGSVLILTNRKSI